MWRRFSHGFLNSMEAWEGMSSFVEGNSLVGIVNQRRRDSDDSNLF